MAAVVADREPGTIRRHRPVLEALGEADKLLPDDVEETFGALLIISSSGAGTSRGLAYFKALLFVGAPSIEGRQVVGGEG